MKRIQLSLCLGLLFFVGTVQPLFKKLSNKESFFKAAAQGHVLSVAYWLNNGIDPNTKDEQDNTALHYAKNKAVMDLLLKKGADINAKNNKGITPLHVHVVMGHSLRVNFLLGHKADVNVRDNNEVTPLHLATMISYFQNPAAAKALAAGTVVATGVGAVVATQTLAASIAVANEAAIIAVSILGDWGEVAAVAGTAETTAAASTVATAIAMVVGVLVTVDIAVRNYILERLLQEGADPRAQDADGNTPLHTLSSGSLLKPGERHGGVLMAQLIIDSGAIISGPSLRTIKNYKGDTPYDIAKKNGRLLLMPVLKVRKRLLFN